jgi:hypothetical protein
MRTRAWLRRAFSWAIAVGLLGTAPALPQATQRPAPRLEAVAEARLLMQGINLPNFHGLQKLLKEKPAEADAWIFGRGQALLIAENGNLLLLRPPRSQGQDVWMTHATDLRSAGTRMARTMAARDYDGSRKALVELTNVCNRCHRSFRVATQLTPFGD